MFDHARWSLPGNSRDLQDGVVWAAGGELSLHLDAPPSLLCEATIAGTALVLHLVNFAASPVEGTRLTLRADWPGELQKALEISPEAETREADFEIREGRLHVRLGRIDVYLVLVLEFDRAP